MYPKGTAIPVRADFNTLDNPFAWSERPDEIGALPAAGVHFVVFNPTGDDFHRNRLAMDGVLPGGKIPFKPRAREQGFNSVLSTTHRQNFLVPPRRHRSVPARRALDDRLDGARRWLDAAHTLDRLANRDARPRVDRRSRAAARQAVGDCARVPTTAGDLWFKAAIPVLAHEPSVATPLASPVRRRPGVLVATSTDGRR